jgi:hypothetical protein
MLLPAATGLGVPLFVTARPQAGTTGVTMLVLLLAELGSEVAEDTEEFAVIEAEGTGDARFTTTMMAADAPDAKLVVVQVTLPVAPTAGVVHDQPTGAETEANVVLAGVASRKLTVEAAAGPLFVTAWV